MKRAYLAALLVVLVAGCTDLHTDLQDGNGKWAKTCRAVGWGIIPGVIAHFDYNQCMDEARATGLKPIN